MMMRDHGLGVTDKKKQPRNRQKDPNLGHHVKPPDANEITTEEGKVKNSQILGSKGQRRKQ